MFFNTGHLLIHGRVNTLIDLVSSQTGIIRILQVFLSCITWYRNRNVCVDWLTLAPPTKAADCLASARASNTNGYWICCGIGAELRWGKSGLVLAANRAASLKHQCINAHNICTILKYSNSIPQKVLGCHLGIKLAFEISLIQNLNTCSCLTPKTAIKVLINILSYLYICQPVQESFTEKSRFSILYFEIY